MDRLNLTFNNNFDSLPCKPTFPENCQRPELELKCSKDLQDLQYIYKQFQYIKAQIYHCQTSMDYAVREHFNVKNKNNQMSQRNSNLNYKNIPINRLNELYDLSTLRNANAGVGLITLEIDEGFSSMNVRNIDHSNIISIPDTSLVQIDLSKLPALNMNLKNAIRNNLQL